MNGQQVAFPDQSPYVDNNSRTLVPVRFISEALGLYVDYEKIEGLGLIFNFTGIKDTDSRL